MDNLVVRQDYIRCALNHLMVDDLVGYERWLTKINKEFGKAYEEAARAELENAMITPPGDV